MMRLAVLVLALVSGVAYGAAASCYTYSVSSPHGSVSGPYPSGSSPLMCDLLASAIVGYTGYTTVGYGYVTSESTATWVAFGDFGRCDMNVVVMRTLGPNAGTKDSFQTYSGNITRSTGTVECPPENPCEARAGETIWGTGSFSAGACYGGCRTVLQLPTLSLFATGPGDDDFESSSSRVSHWRYSGEACPTEPGEGEDEEDLPPEGVENIACVTTAKGQVCLAKEKPGCGMFNGQRFCADQIPNDQCVFTESGDAICMGDGGPVDEEGERLDADMAAEYVDELAEPYRVNIFRYSTVITSAEPVAGASAPGASGDGIKGPPGSEDETGLPEYDDDWDAAGGMSGVIAQVGESNWIGVLTGSAAALSGSSECPSVTMDVSFMDASFDIFEAACEYMEPHYGLWTLMMQVAWGLLALRVFWVSGKS